ncbi:uncharacterized protein RMCC_0922 [Mycolicibacterium canariasense]|uniref:VWFA domain-containing protein n=1 Tax=Mycolicibacterium canariasense TaxID=228230 RepID=A0A100W8Z1_MYCCR|nr:hypothetical protein [Mycolicibacterium canariasense]MCV7213212.1 hypothetical protein [Mycolicibacterium canariasense]ORV19357.1 hypothetical protein AWB94_33005 [Mycolicibacterium canariasense]GAS93956.1 uncharacterized protein RMCC_0922 [Mycolicibacterium canariasense]
MRFLPVLHPLLLLVLTAAILWCVGVALVRIRSTGWSRKALWRWAGLSGAAVLLVLAGARPVFGDDVQKRPVGESAPSVFVVLDRSSDMAAAMDAARADIGALIDRYPRARFALISFAAEPTLDWPLSADTWSLRPVVAALHPDPQPVDGIGAPNAGAAATVLRYQLISARQQYPRAGNLVFYLGAGTSGSGAPAREFDLTAGAVTGGGVLGYADADVGTLRRIAGQIGVPYLPRADAAPLDTVLPDDRQNGRQAPAETAARLTEIYWAAAAVAAALLLAELFAILREFRRTRSVDVEAS